MGGETNTLGLFTVMAAYTAREFRSVCKAIG